MTCTSALLRQKEIPAYIGLFWSYKSTDVKWQTFINRQGIREFKSQRGC